MLRIKDSTGSYRGYIWRIVLTEYGKFDFFHKAFGVGTDALLTFFKNAYGKLKQSAKQIRFLQCLIKTICKS